MHISLKESHVSTWTAQCKTQLYNVLEGGKMFTSKLRYDENNFLHSFIEDINLQKIASSKFNNATHKFYCLL